MLFGGVTQADGGLGQLSGRYLIRKARGGLNLQASKLGEFVSRMPGPHPEAALTAVRRLRIIGRRNRI